jgi:hypothetical protein
MRDIVDQEGFEKFIQLDTEVTSAIWDEGKSRWIIKSRQKIACEKWEDREEEFHFFVNASGFLK